MRPLLSLCVNRPVLMQPEEYGFYLNYLAQEREGLKIQVTGNLAAEHVVRPNYQMRELDGPPEELAIIPVIGPLLRRHNPGEFASGGPTTYNEVEAAITEAFTNPQVKSLLLQIDSPGGEVSGLPELADFVYSLRGQGKGIYAFADGDAYSAAYWLASAADEFYMTPSGGAGSIGVIASHVDVSRYDKAHGLVFTTVYAGARKNDFNPHSPLTKEALEVLQNRTNELYDNFVSTVARNRGVHRDIARDTEAGLLTAEEAVAFGLADGIKTFGEMITYIQDGGQTPVRVKASSALSGRVKVAASTEPPEPETEDVAVEDTVPVDPDDDDSDDGDDGDGDDTVTAEEETEEETVATAAAGAAQEIIAMCTIFGNEQLAITFIKKGLTVSAVRAKLLALRASNAGPQISNHVVPALPAANSRGVVVAAEKLVAASAKKGA